MSDFPLTAVSCLDMDNANSRGSAFGRVERFEGRERSAILGFEPFDRSKVGDARTLRSHSQSHQDIPEILFNVDTVEFACCNDRIEHCHSFPTVIGADGEPVLSSNGQVADDAFIHAIINRQIAPGEKDLRLAPMVQGIVGCLADTTFGKNDDAGIFKRLLICAMIGALLVLRICKR